MQECLQCSILIRCRTPSRPCSLSSPMMDKAPFTTTSIELSAAMKPLSSGFPSLSLLRRYFWTFSLPFCSKTLMKVRSSPRWKTKNWPKKVKTVVKTPSLSWRSGPPLTGRGANSILTADLPTLLTWRPFKMSLLQLMRPQKWQSSYRPPL